MFTKDKAIESGHWPNFHLQAVYKMCCLSMLMVSMAVMTQAEESTDTPKTQFVPLAQYERVDLSSQHIRSLSAGMLIDTENTLFVGMLTQHAFEQSLGLNVAKEYAALDLLLDAKKGRHQYLGVVKAESDQLSNVRLENMQAAAVYGYEWYRSNGLSVVAGGGLALGDFGIETASGDNWPLIPVPLLRINSQTEWLHTQFEFLTSPNLSFSLAPESQLRFKGDIRMDQMRDIRDVIFEAALEYRFFSEDSAMGDFAGVSVGFKNDTYHAFTNANQSEEAAAEVQYQAVFAAVDLSLLKLTTGYAMNARTRFDNKENETLGEGFYMVVQGMYAF